MINHYPDNMFLAEAFARVVAGFRGEAAVSKYILENYPGLIREYSGTNLGSEPAGTIDQDTSQAATRRSCTARRGNASTVIQVI